ncbi:chemotaxis protein CheY [Bacillus sp. FJAT-27916]|uniref:response regulator transcription factor n=1 Tax=Bacillaceae TaxID=186817 RepID=UPI0006709BEF|nr:response regulator transcription factor [Bacillus sp. FJAT-27916]KMY43521.1 chemotaxis protein CheY [Bacillus sp. FJAT-27916]
MSKKVLVVEDEESIITLLTYNLEQAGFTVIKAMDGEMGKQLAMTERPDVIILDLMLPKLDGIEVCKILRQNKVAVPILMLTAKSEEFDKVLGLELGADDYMTKPFSPREVVARVKALLRRVDMINTAAESKEDDTDLITVGELKIYIERYEAYLRDGLLELTPKEFELLAYLAKNKSRILTRDQLLNVIWNYDFVGDTRIVDVHISHLREKIEQDTKKPVYIKTVRGLGYKLEEPR